MTLVKRSNSFSKSFSLRLLSLSLLTAAAASEPGPAPWGEAAARAAFADLQCLEDFPHGPLGDALPPGGPQSRFRDARELEAAAVAPFLALQRALLTGDAAAWALDGAFGAERLREALDGGGGVGGGSGGSDLSSGRPAPFVQRLLLPANATVATFGDLHGSYHSLLRSLRSLAAQGFLDAESFSVAPARRRDFFMLFLGDYVDRGLYGVEVLAALLQLKTANPANVFMVRGNHEDFDMNGDQAGGLFLRELRSKFPGVEDAQLRRVFRVYETLPSAIFLGVLRERAGGGEGGEGGGEGGEGGGGGKEVGSGGRADVVDGGARPEFLLCCHGGLEVGAETSQLLKAPVPRGSALASGAISHFALLHGVFRQRWLDSLPRALRRKVERGVQKGLFRDIGGCPRRRPARGDGLRAGWREVAESPAWGGGDWPLPPTELQPHLGFMWNDFFVNGRQQSIAYRAGRGFAFGHELTEYVLRTSGIVGVLRAHQHNDSPDTGPMLSSLKEATPPGVFDNFARSGLVLTFLSGALIPGQGFAHDAYGLLRLRGADAAAWAVEVCANRVGEPIVAARDARGGGAPPVTCNPRLDFKCADMGWSAAATTRAGAPAAEDAEWEPCSDDSGSGDL